MGLLNQWSRYEKITADDASIRKSWQQYLQTLSGKRKLIDAFQVGSDAQPIIDLLALELVDIRNEEIAEEDVIEDLESIRHEDVLHRFQRLDQCFAYLETRYVYAQKLIEELAGVLRSQMKLAQLLQTSTDASLVWHLKQLQELEEELLNRINERWSDFGKILVTILRGEQAIQRLEGREMDLGQRLAEGIFRRRELAADSIDQSIVFRWQHTLVQILDEQIADAIANQVLRAHRYVDLEFVNRPEFLTLASEVLQKLRGGRKANPRTVKALVEIFRDWYNFERPHPAD